MNKQAAIPQTASEQISEMTLKLARILAIASYFSVALHAQETVCGVFRDLKAFDGRQIMLTGELIISRDIAVIGAGDCDNKYVSNQYMWPTGLRLRASSKVPAPQIQRLRDAAMESDRLRHEGRTVSASASVTGRVRLAEAGDFPGEVIFDSLAEVKVEALRDASELTAIPICELFRNLASYKGQRIAVRGEVGNTSEGSWLFGRCKGGFYTNGYRWPVALSYAAPEYYSSSLEHLIQTKEPSTRPKGFDEFRGRRNSVEYATYVGRLRMRDDYTAACLEKGRYATNGFGHLNSSAAEIVVEEIREVELSKPPLDRFLEEEPTCQPSNLSALCATATLSDAAALGCAARVEALLKSGIDSKDGGESDALSEAIGTGNAAIVKMLLSAGAPVNPRTFRLWPPLAEAAHRRKLDIMMILLKAGANVDAVDHHGETYLAGYGYFDDRVLEILLSVGANPNATDEDGRTALMQAAHYGYEKAAALLIEHGASVDQKDHRSRTALMYAAMGEYIDAIPHLLSQGADLHAQDSEGKTALDLARASKNEAAVELLSAAMASRHQ